MGASRIRGPWFESRPQQIYKEHLFLVICLEKMKINYREAEMAHLTKIFRKPWFSDYGMTTRPAAYYMDHFQHLLVSRVEHSKITLPQYHH